MSFRAMRKAIRTAPLLERPLGHWRDRLEPRFRALENSRYANLLFIWALERGDTARVTAGQRQYHAIAADLAAFGMLAQGVV